MSTKMLKAKTHTGGFATSGKARRALRGGKILALLLTAPLGACGVQRVLPPPVAPHDYHDRHPVVLADTPHVLDIFPADEHGSVDYATEGRIREFVARYRELGHGQVALLTPVGSAAAAHTSATVGAVRRALASAGLRGNILVGTYQVTDAHLAAPVRLSFQSLKAKVSGRCGEWPTDLASGTSLEGWQNQSYWNFGCASQQTLSAQIADPRDLASPRGETASDIEMRMRAINRVRRGEDPTTIWKLKPSSISNVGGQ